MSFGRLETESAKYREVRDELQRAEVALRDQREKVAALRRQLPLDTEFDDVELEELRDGKRVPIRLSELFEKPDLPLILMQFMFGKAQEQACPMCSMWADGYARVVPHLRQRVNFAVLVGGNPEGFAELASERGWSELRAVSGGTSDLKLKLGFERPDGQQLPGVSVFVRKADGSLRHFYSQSAMMGEDGWRGMDLLSPVWNYFDLTPEGRGEFTPSLGY